MIFTGLKKIELVMFGNTVLRTLRHLIESMQVSKVRAL